MFCIPDSPHPFSIDLAHNVLLAGMILSLKPKAVLELGIGPGYTTRTVLQCLQYNGCGVLTCVDNWYDTQGHEPGHIAELREQGATVIVSTEEAFVRRCASESFDVLVSDADHLHSHEWVGEHLRLVRPGGCLFFHDTNNAEFPNLAFIVQAVKHLPYRHFTEVSRPEEKCERGWLMVLKPCM